MDLNKSTLTEIQMNERAKAVGTVLDERYELKEPVGYGGFSIVYDAVNLHSGHRVAIKECIDSTNKERFMREARLLRDFSDEPAIVSVIDYFEEEGTAYIVMEFLEGQTLRDEIKENGIWDAEKTVRLFNPVMKTLERMHNVGVIHRDISPDNLMVLEDGSLKLLDFGAAKENVDKTVSKIVVKASYSPPEQMDEKGAVGSWSDVYSTCATMYYCITGNNPEDALSRMFLDELKAPTRFGANILAAAEKTLMKGLSTESRNRVQDMHQLREELEKTYPILTEEEKYKLKKQKAYRRNAIIAAVAASILLLSIHLVRNSVTYKMMLQDTQTAHLIWEHNGVPMTDEERTEAKAIIKQRIDALAGKKNYLWKDNDEENESTVEIPTKIIGENDYAKVLEKYVTKPIYECMLIDKDDYNVNKATLKINERSIYWFDKGDISKITPRDKWDITIGENEVHNVPAVEIRLKNIPGNKKHLLLEKGRRLFVLFNTTETELLGVPAVAQGDGETVYLIPQESVDNSELREIWQDDIERVRTYKLESDKSARYLEALEYALEDNSRYSPAVVFTEPHIQWESSDSLIAGKNQVDKNDDIFKDSALVIEYKSLLPQTDPDWARTMAVAKERLDHILYGEGNVGWRYAFGSSLDGSRNYAIKIPAETMSMSGLQTKLTLLGWTHVNVYLSCNGKEMHINHAFFIYKNNCLYIDAGFNDANDGLQGFIDAIKVNGSDQKIAISFWDNNYFPIGYIYLQDVSDEMIESRLLPLREINIENIDADKDGLPALADYLNTVQKHSITGATPPMLIQRLYWVDKNNNYLRDEQLANIEGGLWSKETEKTIQLDKQIKSKYGENNKASIDLKYGKAEIVIEDNSINSSAFENGAVERIVEYMKHYDSKDLNINRITIQLSNYAEGPETENDTKRIDKSIEIVAAKEGSVLKISSIKVIVEDEIGNIPEESKEAELKLKKAAERNKDFRQYCNDISELFAE